MVPVSTFCKPAIPSNNSFCPLPAIPAIPNISPPLIVNEMLFIAFLPSLFNIVKFSITNLGLGFTGSFLLVLYFLFY